MEKITIVMPFLNEKEEPIKTAESIHSTADPNLFTILAIDDCSKEPIAFPKDLKVKYLRNDYRLGSGASKHMGAMMAQTPCVFIIDAHMRFKDDNWLDRIIESVEREPQTAWCTTCVGLGYGTMTMEDHKGKYYGADMMFIDPRSSGNRPAREILEPKWRRVENAIEYEIPCILGANYAFSTEWFKHIMGMEGLKMWGSEEPFISMKSWMAGGKCKIRRDIEIGHKFRDDAPYATQIKYLVYNKIYMCRTIFPEDMGEKLINLMPQDQNFKAAMKLAEVNKKEMEAARTYYSSIFKSSIYDYANKFGFKLP